MSVATLEASVTEHNQATSVDVDTNEKCGFLICCTKYKGKRVTSDCLRYCNNPKAALFVLSFVFLMQGFLVNGIINVIYSTLEKRFYLRSTETGFISSCYDIGFCVTSIIVAFYGERGHKPIYLGCSIFFMGISSILFSLPHFIATKYSLSNSSDECSDILSCNENLRSYRGFFIASQLLIGMAAAPLLSLAPIYLDENVKQTYSSTYHGILYANLFIGAGIGFLVGGALLSSFTNLGESINITSESIHWIGNWWAGFLIGGFILILISLPTSMFPRKLPGTDEVRAKRMNKNMTNDEDEQTHKRTFRERFRIFLQTFLTLLKNRTFVCITISISMDLGLVTSLVTFGPKYVETMFGLTPTTAALYFGILSFCCAVLGNVIGGFLVTKLEMNVRQMIITLVICSIISFGFYFGFFYRCDDIDIIGVTSPFHGQAAVNCASICEGCSTNYYQPVCGSDNNTYTSYCAADCMKYDNMSLTNCSRVLDSVEITAVELATAANGVCSTNACSNLAFFMIMIAMSVFTGFLKVQPSLQITLRSVPFDLRTFAFALQLLVARLLGSIPLPIFFGSVLDLACLVWEVECNECGSCRAYSNSQMSTSMALTGGCTKLIGIFCVLFMWKTYDPATVDTIPKGDDHEVDVGGQCVTETISTKYLPSSIIYNNSVDLEEI